MKKIKILCHSLLDNDIQYVSALRLASCMSVSKLKHVTETERVLQ